MVAKRRRQKPAKDSKKGSASSLILDAEDLPEVEELSPREEVSQGSSYHVSSEEPSQADSELELALEEEEDFEDDSDIFEEDERSRKRKRASSGRKGSRRRSSRAQSSEELEQLDVPEESQISFPENIHLTVTEVEEEITISTAVSGDLVSSYLILRSFSWQLRLSPFSFTSFCAAMISNQPNQIMDEIHVSLLRALAIDEVRSERLERKLNLEYLDFMTWPCFVWEWLQMKGYRMKYLIDDKKIEEDAIDDEITVPDKLFVNGTNQLREMISQHKTQKSQQHPARPEYNSMPIDIKASILRTLCDSVLERPSIRAEIDRRESNGEEYAGKGGERGAFAIMNEKERAKATEKALKMQQTDANTEKCVLCGLGGVLMCCDGCPAAYHMRCAGETGRVLELKHWKCPECLVGGRGEAAGLRLATAARLSSREPLYLFNGMVVHCRGPRINGHGQYAIETSDEALVNLLFGNEALELFGMSHHVPRCKLVPSSKDSLQAFPDWPIEELPTTLDGYINKYKNGWTAAAAAIRSHVEDTRKRRAREKLWIPNGTCNRVLVQELPVPMSISRYQWISVTARALGRTTIRCGKCHTCLRPSLRKGCLNPIVKAGEQQDHLENTKMGYLVALLSRMEKDFWPLLEGKWNSEGGGSHFRNRWIGSLRKCSSIQVFKELLLEFESSLRIICFTPDWYKNFPEGLSTQSKIDPKEEPHFHQDDGNRSDASNMVADVVNTEDVYDVENDETVGHLINRHGEWVTKNYKSSIAIGQYGPTKCLLRKAILQAGRKPIPGVLFKKNSWKIASKRLLWIAEVESSQNSSEMAIAIRKLDAALRWESIAKPKHLAHTMYSSATLKSKQKSADGMHEYVLELSPEELLGDEEESGQQMTPGSQIMPGPPAGVDLTSPTEIKVAQKRCGHCSTCKNPNSKKACITLAAKRHAEQVNSEFSKILQDSKALELEQSEKSEKIESSIKGEQHSSMEEDLDGGQISQKSTAVWTHETKLPLWLVRGYEETVRRNAARKAMQDLQNAIKPKEQETTAEKMKEPFTYNPDTEKGPVCDLCENSISSHAQSSFIDCSKCKRKFHGYCVILTNEEVESMNDTETWICPGCTGSSKLIARLEKEPKAGQNLPGVVVDPAREQEKMQKKHPGRPTKPFYERSDYKTAERKEILRRLRESKNPDMFEIFDAAVKPQSQSLLIPKEELMPYDGLDDDSYPHQDIHCPVCQYPDLGRPLYTCVLCARQFHKECLGIVTDIPRLLDPKKVKCAECSGKRVRPPSENVIHSAIEAAQEPVHDSNSIEERVKQRSKRLQAEKESKDSSVLKTNWMEAAERVLTRVSRLHVAEAFRFPVPLDVFTDYLNFVENPVDLDTIRSELYSYMTPLKVVDQIDLIVKNCIAYNGEDSKVTGAALHMQRSFARLWKKEGLPLTEKDEVSDEMMAKVGGNEIFDDPTPVLKPSPLAVGEPASDWQRRAGRVLSQISRLPCAEHFLRPVPKGFLNYHDIIKKPMDLGTVKSKMADGRYLDPSQLLADIELIWSNCIIFNQPGTPIVEDCEATKAAFEKAWQEAKVMIEEPVGGSKPSERATRIDDWVEQARGVLYRIFNFVPQAAWFYDPVDEEEAPGYSEVVKNPIDLNIISNKLQAGEYPAPGNLVADMDLITKNAEAYNGPDSDVAEAAYALAAAFKKYWKNAGLGSAMVPLDGPNDWIAKATSVVEQVINHPSSWPFAQPVTERTAPGYSRLIKKPMDFSTVRYNLQKGVYAYPGEVADDVGLIFQNCRTYNPPGDEIRAMGSEVESMFRKTWESVGLPVPRRWKKR